MSALSGTGKVPVLIDRRRRGSGNCSPSSNIWRGKFPAGGLWPRDRAARAHARTVATEMHSGFVPLRSQLPMNSSGAGEASSARSWCSHRECHAVSKRSGAIAVRGSGRAGRFSVRAVRRCRRDVCAGGVALPHLRCRRQRGRAHLHGRRCMALPAWNEWRRGGATRIWVLPHDEVDWPTVLRESLARIQVNSCCSSSSNNGC